jgi:AcrR family transcriptional regulator
MTVRISSERGHGGHRLSPRRVKRFDATVTQSEHLITDADAGQGATTNVVALADRPRRVRARRGEGDRLRDEIIDAVEALLIAHGSEGVSIRAVGQLVGVTAPSIYRHFDDKDSMVHAACQRAFDRFDAYLLDSTKGAANPLEAIHASAIAYLRFAEANPSQYRVLFMSEDGHHNHESHDLGSTEMKGLVHIAEMVKAAMDAGFVARIAEPIELAVMLWSMVHGIAALRISMPDFEWPTIETQANLMFSMLANGMCPLDHAAKR